MKKTVAFFASLAMLALFVSCGSTANVEPADSYEDETEATAIPLTQKKTTASDGYSPSSADSYSKKKGRANKTFMEQLLGGKKFEKYDETNVEEEEQ